MADKFVNFRSFNDKAPAEELYKKLAEQGIPVKWEDSEGFFEASFVQNEILNLYYIKLRPEDFNKAEKALKDMASQSAGLLREDYYLFSFSNDELIDVLRKPDEWNEFDRFWAQNILEKRNIKVQEEELEQIRNNRLEELKKPWKLDKLWIVGGIFLVVVSLYYLLPYYAFGAIFLGIYISFGKKTLPNGERVKAFSPTDRLIGKIILCAGVLISLLILLYTLGFIDFSL